LLETLLFLSDHCIGSLSDHCRTATTFWKQVEDSARTLKLRPIIGTPVRNPHSREATIRSATRCTLGGVFNANGEKDIWEGWLRRTCCARVVCAGFVGPRAKSFAKKVERSR